jgi:HAE1 family hydrophobic/amphiphilic exporter-1
MTAFTTMFGLIPMAIGGSNLMGIPYAPLGRVVMGGLFTSTFFTLLATPLLYTYLDDFRIWLAAFVRDVMQRTTILRNRMAASDSFADNPES